jgi:hypothetical protein
MPRNPDLTVRLPAGELRQLRRLGVAIADAGDALAMISFAGEIAAMFATWQTRERTPPSRLRALQARFDAAFRPHVEPITVTLTEFSPDNIIAAFGVVEPDVSRGTAAAEVPQADDAVAIQRFIAERGVTKCPAAFAEHSVQAGLRQQLPSLVFNWETRKFRRVPA